MSAVVSQLIMLRLMMGLLEIQAALSFSTLNPEVVPDIQWSQIWYVDFRSCACIQYRKSRCDTHYSALYVE